MIIKKTIKDKKEKTKSPWAWIPTLYFAEGLPYVIVITVSVIMYKRLGVSNSDIALYTSWLYLPWVIKPLWSPFVDIFKTKRFWIIIMQLLIGAGLAGVALTIPVPDFFQFTLAFFWLIAFSSATHDIAADGFYMLSLSESKQSFFVGIRSTFYRIAMIAGQGLLVILAGYIESTLSLSPAEVKIIAKPEKFFENTIKVDSSKIIPLEGSLRIIAKPSVIEISTHPQTRETVNFFLSFAQKFNIINGFSKENLIIPDTSNIKELVGNVGLISFHLSKKPDEDKNYIVTLNFENNSSGFSILTGKTITFNSKNWNKPAYAVIQIDPLIQNKYETILKIQSEKIPVAWIIPFILIAILYFIFFIYHNFILPKPTDDKSILQEKRSTVIKEFFRAFFRFFEKEKILLIIGFLLLYRLGEAQLVKLVSPFMLDSRESGGLGLSTSDVGLIYGTIGMIALITGGILGGFLISKKGLKSMLMPMLIALNLPDLLYVYLSYVQPTNLWIIYTCVSIEQFGYGLGFTAYMMFMIYISEGEYKTSHYAISTGFMALGMMIPGMFSGMIQEAFGYRHFFIWVCIATIPSFILAKYIKINPSFGKRDNTL
ncbi:MFS transporter [Rosettibacter firmus]|uniref:MFS transporter n=1 Tax=Rosettibacter firmus TaxID=3111522 RepID=UPI00336C1179